MGGEGPLDGRPPWDFTSKAKRERASTADPTRAEASHCLISGSPMWRTFFSTSWQALNAARFDTEKEELE